MAEKPGTVILELRVDSTEFQRQLQIAMDLGAEFQRLMYQIRRSAGVLEAAPLLKFRYTNWRGDEHTYVIDVEQLKVGLYRRSSTEVGPSWLLHGYVVTRDGDPRPDMGSNRRRTFLLSGIKDIEEVARSR